jgi:hypothetical protein
MRAYLACSLRACSLWACSFALAALLSGCGRSATQDAVPASMATGGGAPHFLARIPDAPFQTAYYARRRVWQSFQDALGSETLEYTESVWSDGQGHFNVTPEQLVQPVLSTTQAQTFLLLQRAREGFIYRLRDFRIQELGAFLDSYSVEDLDQRVDVAGRTCERLRVRPVNPGTTYWELDVDPATGLILGTREFQVSAGHSTLVGEVETLEYQANPNLSGVALHQDLPAVPFTAANAQQVLGFTPLQPTFLPQGFALARSEQLSQGGENWARFTYTNGGESLFLLYRHEPLSSTPVADPAGPYTIKIFRAGRWSVAQATLGRHRIITLGREPAAILQQMLESCAP